MDNKNGAASAATTLTVRVHGQRLTPAQARLYQALVHAPAPLSAYQLLDRLNADVDTHVYPQTVYRALTQLRAKGLVHRVESANAYIPCRAPSRPHRGIHLLCDRCGCAQEIVDAAVSTSLDADAAQQHFRIDHQVVELHGLCASCQRAEAN
ncbi:MAG TPA: Fur family transcriptional regulator [Nevskiaceae bacterium]|nr:Fur family transcriptional regulator [Nevskiaceae bacterium]